METIEELCVFGTKKLVNLQTPQLDSEVLLSHVLNTTREHILTHPKKKIFDDKIKAFKKLIKRRKKHEPIAYLTHNKEFYRRNFYVDERVHVPRAATEDMINHIKDRTPANFSGTIVDIGTGSGCIAITLAYEFPKAKIIATDISQNALDVARRNAEKHKLTDRIIFLLGDNLKPVKQPVDILISNPPYGWDTNWTDDKEVAFQPQESYLADNSGLNTIQKLLNNISHVLNTQGQAYIEFDPRQTEALTSLIPIGFDYKILKDLAGHDRVLHLTN
jgi:release factor glutamine methyltransferase